MKNITSDLYKVTPEQVATVGEGVTTALAALGIALDGKTVFTSKWRNEHELTGEATVRNGTLSIDYSIKTVNEGDEVES